MAFSSPYLMFLNKAKKGLLLSLRFLLTLEWDINVTGDMAISTVTSAPKPVAYQSVFGHTQPCPPFSGLTALPPLLKPSNSELQYVRGGEHKIQIK